MPRDKKFLIIIMLIFGALVGAAAYRGWYAQDNSNQTQRGDETAGRMRVKNYRHFEPSEVVCQSMDPNCGVCTGRVIDKQCFVNETELAKLREYSSNVEIE